jgi:hypothetical protein
MRDINGRPQGQVVAKNWWEERTPLEKVGTVALGLAGGLVVAAVLFPSAAAATTGGALTAAGGLLLKKGFGQ